MLGCFMRFSGETLSLRIVVSGIVQGVGFRPFIYRLAKELGLKGYVVNLGGSSVEIRLEGSRESIREFILRLDRDKPPKALIKEIVIEEEEIEGFDSFEIKDSVNIVIQRSMIPPDISICEYCLSEIKEPNSRFYEYYWNSCAWCGPRFSMIYRLPYDRANTSMSRFKLCSECSSSYSNPSDIRRFHAQGISCSKCGPKTYVYLPNGVRIDIDDPLRFIASKILDGAIVAIKGIGGYHIACLASRDDVVKELRVRKKRLYKPFAVMARDFNVVEEIAVPLPGSRELLESPQRPIVVLPKRRGSRISEYVSPGLSTIGVMLPYSGFQHLLMSSIPEGFLIMTSGNKHGKPMCKDLECVLTELSDVVDYIVEHEREIVHRVDDSVLRFTDGKPVFLRRSRGYVPEWIEISVKIPESVAVGAELQVAGAIGFDNKVVLTQFIGDVDEPDSLNDLEKELEWFIDVYRLKPRVVALDKHPLYHSRLVAKALADKYGCELVEVQHHHAHAVSVLGELGAEPDDKYIAITIDGTGYGDDGGIWGGEVLIVSFRDYKRIGSLKPYVLPGGDSATYYPVKTLVSLLASSGFEFGEIIKLLEERDLLRYLPHGLLEAELTFQLASRGEGAVSTSTGRLLDAFSALLGVCSLRTYEGEPPMKLESLADMGGVVLDYEPRIEYFNDRFVIDHADLLEWVIEKINYAKREDLAATIQYSIGFAFGEIVVESIKGLRNVENKVVVSGGAAVNTYIVRGLKEILFREGLELVLPTRIPPGDGGIALGQIIVASCRVGYCE